LERRSANAGERESAEWVAGRLREAGAVDVRTESFRYAHTFAHAQAMHYAGGAVGAAVGGRRGAALAGAALASFELDYSGRSQWLRSVLPAGRGANAVGRVPAAIRRSRTLVLVAHHDAAHTGLIWDPRLAAAGDARAERTDNRAPFSLPVELALALAAGGSLAGCRAARAVAVALLAAGIVLSADVARGAVVPGASDNATGVAAMLALVERFAAEPFASTEVVALAPGCEESGMGGMAAWLRASDLDAESSLVLGLDTLGAGEPILLTAEGPLWAVRYRASDLALADRAAARAGLPRPRRFRIGGWTDPALARIARLPALSLLSVRGGGFTNYHLPSDTPDRVDWHSVERCLELAEAIARQWS
jgi:peptidase M28-like protein